MMDKKRYMYMIEIEPVRIPGAGSAVEDLRCISMNIYAEDIQDAMKKVQDFLRIDTDKYEIMSISKGGNQTWRYESRNAY